MPTVQAKTLNNSKPLKVISTSVPAEMYKALKTQVTDEYTMSHVLRDLIQKSDLMRGGSPSQEFSHDLAKTVVSLQEEIAQLRKDMQTMSFAALAAPAKEPAQMIRTYAMQPPINSIPPSPDYDDFVEFDEHDPDYPWFQNIIQEVIEEDLPMESADEKMGEKLEYMSVETEAEPSEEVQKEPAQEKVRDGKSLFGRLTAMLGVSRKTA